MILKHFRIVLTIVLVVLTIPVLFFTFPLQAKAPAAPSPANKKTALADKASRVHNVKVYNPTTKIGATSLAPMQNPVKI